MSDRKAADETTRKDRLRTAVSTREEREDVRRNDRCGERLSCRARSRARRTR